MTCVIGLGNGKKVWIGGDSCASMPYMNQTSLLPKVFAYDNDIVVGYSGSFRVGQLLKNFYKPSLQISGMSNEEYIFNLVVGEIRQMLTEQGIVKNELGVESMGANVLLGYKGVIYYIASDFQANYFAEQFCAIGAGDSYAMVGMELLKHLKPTQRITKTLEAVAKFSPDVAPPFTIISR